VRDKSIFYFKNLLIPEGSMPKVHGQERGNTLRVYLYAQRSWAGKRKHPTGIPLCPKTIGRKEERRFLYE
jgi:hypothetical protein